MGEEAKTQNRLQTELIPARINTNAIAASSGRICKTQPGSQISWIVPNLELISSIMSVCDVMYVIWMATCSCVADYIDQCLIRIDYLGSWDSGTGIKDIKVFQCDCMANLRREETQSISITIIIHFGIRTSPPLKKTRRTIQRITQLASRAVPSASHLTYLASLADKAAVTKRQIHTPPDLFSATRDLRDG